MRGYEIFCSFVSLFIFARYESPCGVMRLPLVLAMKEPVWLRIPMRGYEVDQR